MVVNKRTALYESHLKLNAKIVPFAGWEMPVSYPAGIIAEHNAVRNAVGIFDVGHMGLIKLSNQIGTRRLNVAASNLRGNRDVQSQVSEQDINFLQSVTTNDASKLEVNQVQYSVLCNEKGGVVDDILLFRLADHFMIIANASNTDKVMAWLKERAGKVEIALDEQSGILSIQGPRAEASAGKVLGVNLAELKRNRVLLHQGMLLSRTGYTGEDGLEIVADKNKMPALWESFIKQGVQPCGLGARDTLRLEAGLPLYGHEYDDETTPLEAGYGWAVKFDKGDFIGREALLKEKNEGLRKMLVGLELEGMAIPRQGNLTLDFGHRTLLGKVTSGTFSPTFKRPIALAYLTGAAKEILVEIRGEQHPAKVVDKAFYKRVK